MGMKYETILHEAGRGDRIVPDFFIVGAAKAGTTSLYHALRQHPTVFVPSLKEPHFFAALPEEMTGPGDREHTLRKVVRTWEAYGRLFRDKAPDQICGEASPSYLYYFESALRIRGCNPKARIIMVLRNPIDRAFSFYMHMRRDNREPLTFEAALEQEEFRERNGWEWSWFYKKVGLYSRQVEAFLDAFGEEQVNVSLYDDLEQDTMGVVKNIYRFLAVSDAFVPRLIKYNVSGNPRNKWLQGFLTNENWLKSSLKALIKPETGSTVKNLVMQANVRKEALKPKTRALLKDYFENDIRRLERILRRDLSPWMA